MSEFEQRKERLKKIRNKFLRFHKVLLDWDRANYEREFGALSSGKFLEMLLSDERFAWLRTISTLIVRIDEAFDLDDGLSDEMLNGFYEESRNFFDDSDEYLEFKSRLSGAMDKLPEAKAIRDEIQVLLK
ncbi:MAG: hypothetical protein HKN25_15895 [Pyrinomonadaceae bacterium]|nr:hypothetical protein [Pyrinomonadaceae bacterium]